MKRTPWYKEDKGKVHEAVAQTVSAIGAQSRHVREDNRFYLDLASNGQTAGNDVVYSTSPLAMIGRRASRMRYNLACAGVDTAASLIAQNRTVPIWTTTAGRFDFARRAEQKSRCLQGQFYDLRVFELAADVFYDGAVTNLGAIYGYVETDADGKNPRPCLERVLPNEWYVDDADGRYRDPRNGYRVRFPAKEVLQARCPDLAEQIERSAGPTPEDHVEFYIRSDPGVERVRVIEAWHLPSAKGADDGRYVMCTDKAVLVDEPYSGNEFPLAFYRYMNRRIGFFGQGLVERACPAQIRINELMKVKQACQDLVSNAFVMVPRTAQVQWEDLTNMPGQQCSFSGPVPPQLAVWSGTPPDIVAEIEAIKQEFFQQEGLSEATVGGEREKGLNSGRAQRAVDDIKSRRLIMPLKQFENFFLDVTRLICRLNDRCAEIDPNYMVRSRKRTGRQTFVEMKPWSELQFDDENDYAVTLFPMSALPTTPAAKFQELDEWVSRGFASKPVTMDLLQFPDMLDAFQSLDSADADLITWQIDRLLDGIPELPIEEQDLKLASYYMTQAYKVAYRMEADDDILQLFQDYLARLQEMTPVAPPAPAPSQLSPEAAAAAQLGGQAPMPMPAQGAPMMNAAA